VVIPQCGFAAGILVFLGSVAQRCVVTMKHISRIKLIAGGVLILILAVFALVFVSGRGILPPGRVLVGESEEALRAMVLSNAPIGTVRGEVERMLARDFRRQWRVVDYKSTEMVQKLGWFTVPVAPGDYYIESDLAVVSRNWWSSDVVTVYFLFGRSGELKDVAVKKWMDSI
jgi:hypothetical protein